MKQTCDLFCAVIDNYGDAALAWRLARQLARRHGWAVRLFIDDAEPLWRLWPPLRASGGDTDARAALACADGVSVWHWDAALHPDEADGGADVVIEAFACTLPDDYVVRMARRPKTPLWINLEYFSAEDWTLGCHLKSSPHPRLPLSKVFFFPGILPGSGGVLREADADFGANSRIDHVNDRSTEADALRISLFGYTLPALPDLLTLWAQGNIPIDAQVTDCPLQGQVAHWLGKPFPVGCVRQCGALRLTLLPFLPQPEYDRLLGSCALNAVRGEDSLVRAQWACRALVWQPYPQDDNVHEDKRDAFLAAYAQGLPPDVARAQADFWHAWTSSAPLAPDGAGIWARYVVALPLLRAHALHWADRLRAVGELSDQLVHLCARRL
jgi:uncharacterized repeat protein (TIGR03837 family)